MSGVWALVQARMGSSRFPGKVLTPLAGLPLIDHLLLRLGRCPTITGVAVLTSRDASDDALVAHCQSRHVRCFRGPLDNVLERYRLACEALLPDVILRVTGDAPLQDSNLLSSFIAAVTQHRGPAMSRQRSKIASMHEGTDAVNAAALAILFSHGEDPIAREHVTSWFNYHPECCTWAEVPIPDSECSALAIRTSIDTPADLAFLEEAHRRLGAPAGTLRVADLIGLVERDPHLLDINRHICRKDPTSPSRKALVVAEAGSDVGFDRAVRVMAIAEELRDRHGLGLTVALIGDWIRAPFPANVPLLHPEPSSGWLARLLTEQRPEIVILDLPRELAPDDVAALKGFPGRSCAIDPTQAWREAVTDAFYPPTPATESLTWSGTRTARHLGWGWMPVRRSVGNIIRDGGPATGLVIAMGASPSPAEASRRVLKAASSCFAPDRITVILEHDDGLAWPAGTFLAISPEDSQSRLRSAQVVIAAFGPLAHEAANLHRPSILLASTPEQAAEQRAFCSAGFAVDGGLIDVDTEERIADTLRLLLADPDRLHRLNERCREALDGHGATRIAAILAAPGIMPKQPEPPH